MAKRRYRQHRKFSRARSRRKSGSEVLFGIITLFFIGAVVSAYAYQVQTVTLYAIAALLICIPIFVAALLYRRYEQHRKRECFFLSQRYLTEFLAMDPFEFEHFVGWVFEKLGYEVEVTKRSGDHGLDVLLHYQGRACGVQVKRYHQGHLVSEEELRDFYGSFAGSHMARGFFVTTSDFTAPAKEWAKTRPIELINGDMLVDTVRRFSSSPWQLLLRSKSL